MAFVLALSHVVEEVGMVFIGEAQEVAVLSRGRR